MLVLYGLIGTGIVAMCLLVVMFFRLPQKF